MMTDDYPFDGDNDDDDVDDNIVNGKNSGRVNIYCARWHQAILQNALRRNPSSKNHHGLR